MPSESRTCPKSSWTGGVSGWPKSDWYHLRLPATSPTPMIVHVRFIRFPSAALTPTLSELGNPGAFCWAASLLSNRCRGPFVPRLIDTQPPTTRQRHFGEQTPALVLHWATGHAVLTHFRDKHFYVVA